MSAADGQVQAPFTTDQAQSLNAYQRSGAMHPYTCGKDSNHRYLVALTNLYCRDCGYTQYWAHEFTADWTWMMTGGAR